jgi:hypothetical protein
MTAEKIELKRSTADRPKIDYILPLISFIGEGKTNMSGRVKTASTDFGRQHEAGE